MNAATAGEQLCTNCYAGILEPAGGVLVCSNCGLQANVAVEETEFQAGNDDLRFRRRAGASASARLPQMTMEQEEMQAQSHVQAAAFLYCQCIQKLLQAQAAALVSTFGMSAQVPPIMRQMWLSLLPATHLLEPDFYQRRWQEPVPAGASEIESGGEGGSGQEDEGPEHKATAMELARGDRLRKALWKAVHPSTTLELCWLACHLSREVVSPWDILGWALNGLLPFLQWPKICQDLLQGTSASRLPATCLQPSVSGSPLDLLRRGLLLFNQLGLDLALPPVNGEGLLLRAIIELQLPQEVAQVASDLYTRYLLGSAALEFDPAKVAAITYRFHPYAAVSSTIMVALKLLYGLGREPTASQGQGQQQQQLQEHILEVLSSSPSVHQQEMLLQQLQQVLQGQQDNHSRQGGKEDEGGTGSRLQQDRPAADSLGEEGQPRECCIGTWLQWAQQTLVQLPHFAYAFLSTAEVLALPRPLVTAYLRSCREHFLSGQQAPSSLQEFYNLIKTWTSLAEQQTMAAEQEAPSALLQSQPLCHMSAGHRYHLLKSKFTAVPPAYMGALVVLAAQCHTRPSTLQDLVARLEDQMLMVEKAVL